MRLRVRNAMTDKIAVLTVAFQEEKLIKNCIEQFKPFDLFHVVLSNNISWNGNLENDDTPELARKYGAGLVVEGDWQNQEQQSNYGVNLLNDYEWIIICDADERYMPQDLEKILELLKTANGEILRSNMNVYWKTIDYEIIPVQTDFPTIAVRSGISFAHARETYAPVVSWTIYPMYHLSYVRTDEEMLKKIKTFHHSDEFDVMSWYNNVWLPWEPSHTNLHPVVPEQFKQAIFSPLPKEIKA